MDNSHATAIVRELKRVADLLEQLLRLAANSRQGTPHMARKAKEAQVFTVRTEGGERIGTYRAMTAQQAISRATSDFAATAATFRRSQPMPRGMDKLTASVEPPLTW